MRVLLVGGSSSLAQVTRPVLTSFAQVLTAGRAACDIPLDLNWPVERFDLPKDLDAVVHMAAHFGGQDVSSIQAAEEINVLGSYKLAQACHGAGVRHFVYVSSIFAGLNEDSPFFSIYALSKRHAEELVGLYCRQAGLPLAILRPSQLYGEGDSFRRHQPFLYTMLDRAQRGEDITLFGKNDATRNFIHVSDVAEVIAKILQQRVTGHYGCASLCNVRLSDVASTAVAATGSLSQVCFDADKPDIPDNGFASDDTLYRLIGYYPQVSLAQGLAWEVARRRALP